MNRPTLHSLLDYAAAVVSILVATWIHVLLEPLLGDQAPFVTLMAAVVFMAWYGGLWPTLAATVLGAIAALYFFIPPSDSILPSEASGWTGLALYLFVGIGAALLSESRFASLRRVAIHQAAVHDEMLRFNATLTNIGDGVIMVDAAGLITFMNSVAEKLTGWTLAESRGKPIETVYQTIHDRTRSPAENPARKALEMQGAVSLPNFPLLTSKSGSELPIDDHAVPLFSEQGELRGAVLIFRDDTHRRKARKALRTSELRFRTLADSAPVLIWMSDTVGNYNYFNRPWLEFTGRPLEQELGDGWFQGLHTDDCARCQEAYSTAFRTREEFELEYRLRRADGEYRWLLDHGIPVYDTDGEFTGYIGSCIDVTRQRETVDALRDSEERFRAVADHAPAAIFIKDIQGRYVLANPLACEALGRPEIVGLTDHELLPAALAEKLRQRDLQVQAGGEALESEEQVTDGTTQRTFLSVKFPLHNARGELAGVGGVAFDITDRKRSEDRLRESEETFRLMSDSIPQLAWTARPDGHIFWYNQRWYEYTGATPAEMEGRGWEAVYDPADLPRIVQSWNKALAEGVPWEDTFPLRRHDGAMRWHLSRAVPIRNDAGEIVRWFGTHTDIADRKQLENTLRFLSDASEALASFADYQQAMQNLAELAVPAFADWCSVDLIDGEQFQRFAIIRGENSNRSLKERLTPDYRSQAEGKSAIGSLLATKDGLLIEQLTPEILAQLAKYEEHRTLIDEARPVSLICVPLATKGRELGVLTFATGKSERRYTNEDLAVAEEVAHRAGIAVENARLYQELRDADRRKDEFLAMLAHELRNPLAPIRSGLDLISLQAGEYGELVHSMQKQVEHLVRLVDDLLDVSRIMRGKVELRPQKVPLREVLDQVLHAVEPLVQQQRHQLTVSNTDDETWLHADPVRIVQVIENLLTNACKYTDAEGQIELAVSREDSHAVIAVRDNGIGIEPELLPKVFDLFSQSSRTLDRAQGGLGIGLTLVRTLVEMHGGTVAVRSKGVRQGSEFVVRLPTCEPGETVVEQPRAPNASRRVLLCDDNQAAADMLRLLIMQLGPHRAEAVYSGEQALKKIEAFRPEVILLDIGLPGMSGFEVARAIRANPDYDDVLLVALTGYGQEEDRYRSSEAGFDVHLVKPPAMSEICELFSHAKLAAPTTSVPTNTQPFSSRDSVMASTNVELSETQPPVAQPDNGTDELQAMRQVIHDLGNTAHVVAMAAKILEQSSDPADTVAVQRMLNAARDSMIGNIETLRSQLEPAKPLPR